MEHRVFDRTEAMETSKEQKLETTRIRYRGMGEVQHELLKQAGLVRELRVFDRGEEMELSREMRREMTLI